MNTCLKLGSRICNFSTLFKPYNLDIPTPKSWGGGQNGISSSIGYFKMRMKLEKKVNNDVIVISMLWPHHHFDVWPQLKSRFWGFWLNTSKWRNWFSPNVCHFLDNYPQPALKVKDRSIFDGREKKWYFSYDFECVTEFSGKDFKLPHIPNFTLIHRKTAKTWSHFSWCRDTSKIRKWRLWHHTIKLKMASSNFLAIWKDL